MRTTTRLLTFLLVALVAFWFTVVNARESVEVDLVLLRIVAPLPLVVFGSMVIGMIAVLLVGLRSDLRTRRMLARYREVLEGEDPMRGPLQDPEPHTAAVGHPSQEVREAP